MLRPAFAKINQRNVKKIFVTSKIFYLIVSWFALKLLSVIMPDSYLRFANMEHHTYGILLKKKRSNGIKIKNKFILLGRYKNNHKKIQIKYIQFLLLDLNKTVKKKLFNIMKIFTTDASLYRK